MYCNFLIKCYYNHNYIDITIGFMRLKIGLNLFYNVLNNFLNIQKC